MGVSAQLGPCQFACMRPCDSFSLIIISSSLEFCPNYAGSAQICASGWDWDAASGVIGGS